LYYVVEIVEALLGTIAPTEVSYVESLKRQRMTGMILWAETLGSPRVRELLDALVREIKSILPSTCPSCGERLDVDDATVHSLYETGGVTCRCGGTILAGTTETS
jgi:hypothetical protein